MGQIKFQSKVADCLKPRDMLQKPRAKHRQKFRRNSFMKAIRGFLLTDSFMYGPLTTKYCRTAGVANIPGEEREKRSNSSSPKSILKEVFSSPGETVKSSDQILQEIDQLDENSEASGQVVQGTYISVRKTVTTTTVATDDEKGDVRSGLTGVPSPRPGDMEIRGQ